MATQNRQLKVAICGGGIAGLCLLYGLSQHSNLDVTLYEASAEIAGDEGSGVGLAPNAMRALQILGEPLVEAVKKADSVAMHNPYATLMMGSGPHAGAHIVSLASKTDETGFLFQRSKFIEQLFKLVDPARCKTDKKLAGIVDNEQGEHCLTMKFADNSTEEMDCVIGGDGVHSKMRHYVLQDFPDQIDAIFSKSYMYVGMVPMDVAREKLADVEGLDSVQYGWVNGGAFLMHDPANSKETLQVVAAMRTAEVWETDEWVKQKTVAQVSDELGAVGEKGSVIAELITSGGESVMARSIWEHPLASTYNRGKAAILGDAAHAMQPWQAAGAGQAIEDAMVMTTLFSRVASVDDVPAALDAYTAVRRDRTQYAQRMSAETGEMIQGLHPEVGLDLERLRHVFQPRWDELWYFDLLQHQRDALAELERLKK